MKHTVQLVSFKAVSDYKIAGLSNVVIFVDVFNSARESDSNSVKISTFYLKTDVRKHYNNNNNNNNRFTALCPGLPG